MAVNRQAVELERLRAAGRIDVPDTVSKAQEILRRMDVKCRPGSLGMGETFRTLLAFDLACRALGCPIPPKTAMKLCGRSDTGAYAAALGLTQRLLGTAKRYTCKEIAKAVGGARVGIMASEELEKYKERFRAAHPVRQAASIDLDGTVYAVAAFYLCAKKLKHPVYKDRLLELALVSETEFNGVCRSMLDLCYSTLGVHESDKPDADRLQRYQRAAMVNTSTQDKTILPGAGAAKEMLPPRAAASDPISSARRDDSVRTRGTSSADLVSGTKRKTLLVSRDESSKARRGIPLTRDLGGGNPKDHVSVLARSIKAAAGRKRRGGALVACVEPGGGNQAIDTNHDTTYRPHLPSTWGTFAGARSIHAPGDTSERTPTAKSGNNAAARAPTGNTHSQRHLAHNPYAPRVRDKREVIERTQKSGASLPDKGRQREDASKAPSGTAGSPATALTGGGQKAIESGSGSTQASPLSSGGERSNEFEGEHCAAAEGGAIDAQKERLHRAEFKDNAAWKERMLASMENRLKNTDTPSADGACATGGTRKGQGYANTEAVIFRASV